MVNLAASVTIKEQASRFGEVAVEIPLHIFYIRGGQHARYRVKQVVAHVLSRHVEHILAAGYRQISSGCHKAPLGMLLIQAARGGYHLRLKPYAELQPEVVYLLHKGRKPSAQLFFVHEPVSEGGTIVISLTEPSVVHYKHFYTAVRCVLCYGEQLFVVKGKVCGFPVVHKNRSLTVSPFSAAEVLSVQLMVRARHLSKALSRYNENRFGSDKFLSHAELPVKSVGRNACHKSD